jgi:hypothetical protein
VTLSQESNHIVRAWPSMGPESSDSTLGLKRELLTVHAISPSLPSPSLSFFLSLPSLLPSFLSVALFVFLSVCLSFVFETGSYCLTQSSLKLTI